MKIIIAASGKLKKSPELEIFEYYKKRTRWNISLKEIEAKKGDAKKVQEEEGALLLKATEGTARIILDEKGKELSSKDFAILIKKFFDAGKTVSFLIGGADGHTENVKESADVLISFGKATWPHMLVRAMLAEQIYRAYTILNNHPYHRN